MPFFKPNILRVLACQAAFALMVLAFVFPSITSAQTHVVVDRDTGEVLSHHRANRRWAPASLTKVMTAYVAFKAIKLQHLQLNSPVGISANALSQPPTKMGFPVGTILTLENAIKLIMVKSANDVSVAIAESVAGDEETFVALMNAHSRRLGMKDTLYQNPNGLPDLLQYTSAADQARLAIAVRNEFPEYAYLFSVPALKVGRRTLRNFNRLLSRFEGTDGMKTGYICASGYNVIVTAERRGRNLVAVVLGERSGRRRNIKAAEILANVPFAKAGHAAKTDTAVPLLDDLKRVVDWHASKFDLHAPEDISHLVCRRKYQEPLTAQTAVEKQWDREIITARNAEIRRLKEIRVAEEKANQNADEKPEALALVETTSGPVLSATAAIASLTQSNKLPIPVRSPKKQATKKNAEADTKKAKPETDKQKAPSIVDLEKKYFLKKIEPAKVQLVRLGGAFGLNPNGIPVLNGAAYPLNIPVPGSRPDLICKFDEKSEELPEIEAKPFSVPAWDCLPVPLKRTTGLAFDTHNPAAQSQPDQVNDVNGEGDKG